MAKRTATFILIILMLLSVLTGCRQSKDKEEVPTVLPEPTNEEIEAEVLWRFYSMCKIPHTTGNEEEMSRHLEFELQRLGVTCIRDIHNNVIAEIPATPGFEAAPLTILQGHMDMVEAKATIDSASTAFSPITVKPNSTVVQSDKTSALGADCGLANAAVLYLIEQADYIHGPLRVIFTSRGEENMSGAQNIDDMYIRNAHYLINVDGFQLEDIIGGNAAGRREIYQMLSTLEPVTKERAIKIEISGFTGGHYGNDMWQRRANALKIMADLLSRAEEKVDFQLVDWKGGGALNSIPGQSEAIVVVNRYDSPAFEKVIYDIMYEMKEKYAGTDPNGQINYSVMPLPQTALSADNKKKIIALVDGFFDGIYSHSDSDPSDVLTSANVESISIAGGNIRIVESIKSDIPSELQELIAHNAVLNQSAGFQLQAEDSAPWIIDKKGNRLLQIMSDAYKRKTGKEVRIISGHADLETPVFIEKNPELYAVTIGLDIVGAHTINEYAKIDSIGPFVKTLASALRSIAFEIEEE